MSFKELLKEKILSYGTYFDDDVLEVGLQKFKTIKLNAGDHLINSGDVISELFIAEKSISRAYRISENGEEQTLWIEPEMSFLTDMESFRRGTTNQMNVQLYEDSDVMYIEREDLVELYAKYHQYYPRFLDIVPLKHIASRLNVTPITISRIRNDKQKKK